jgi:hypothetical protein
VAAEIWGISVDQILAGIADGSIHSCVDGQFLFVDIRGLGLLPSSQSTPTQEVVTPEEYAALTFEPRETADLIQSGDPFEPEDSAITHDISTWRAARDQTAQSRRPPGTQAA